MNSGGIGEGCGADLNCTRPDQSELDNVFDSGNPARRHDGNVGMRLMDVVDRSNGQRVNGRTRNTARSSAQSRAARDGVDSEPEVGIDEGDSLRSPGHRGSRNRW